jgi:hypothetical protein
MAESFDPRTLLERLSAAGVDFVVVGAVAARLFGTTRVTDDLDICFAPDSANLAALGKVLVEAKARLTGVEEDLPFVPDERTLSRVQILTLTTDAGQLDLMTRPEGAPPYEQLKRRAQLVDIGSVTVRVAALDDLIAMKQAASRDKDVLDLKELRKVRSLRRGRGDD